MIKALIQNSGKSRIVMETKAFPALLGHMRKSTGGQHRSGNPKAAVSLRLDQEFVAWFKAAGPGWQPE